MPIVGKVVTPAGNAEPVSPKRRRESASPANFDSSLNHNAIVVGRDSLPPETQEASWSETARRRTIEELRTLVRAIQSGVTDQSQLTDLIFYARHPELVGVPLTRDQQLLLDEWNAISALLVHPTLNEVGNILGANVIGGELQPQEIQWAFERAAQSPLNVDRTFGDSGRFDEVIFQSVQWCPGLSPAILKSLLAQESNFNPTVINQYGYAGIAQFGRVAAREVGLHVGIAGSETDERLNPYKAIPAAARLLNLKAQRLSELAFSRYGQPAGAEFWKFVLAAYNGGEGTVALAMGHAYRNGLAQAREQGLVGYDAVSFARSYASKWENLRAGGQDSPLGLAAARYFPMLAVSKYHEIANYPTAIVTRSLHARI
ncbi:MAG TPA: transglycosylase SLT domain-containing protein [Pyrinomonadaceae bacterium]|nr:transglycosylase SLT domain-containing protein [Pyrinomonadaceae bacterium]